MVNANELRVGNVVLVNGRERLKVCCIVHTGIVASNLDRHNESTEVSFKELAPVQLTSRVIQGWCLFDNISSGKHLSFQKDGFEISNKGKDKAWILMIFGGVANYNPIESLHQLQNLYFALTGDELDVTVPVRLPNGDLG